MMSIKVTLEGHEERAAVSGMLHHFFSDISAEGSTVFHVLVKESFDSVPVIPNKALIVVSCTPSILPQIARQASRVGAYSDRTVHVRTTLRTDHDELMEEADVQLPLLRETIRRQLFNVLSELTGLQFPWGMLTGVRPTDIALRELEKARKEGGDAEARAVARLIDDWKTSPEKAELAVETAKSEARILKRIDSSCGDMIVYVGLPFCPSRCAYCSFITQDAIRQSKALPDYVDAVIHEAEALFSEKKDTGHILGNNSSYEGRVDKRMMSELPPSIIESAPSSKRRIAAVYFGGGTPTSLPTPLLQRYLEGVLRVIPTDAETELTMEAGRPDTLDEEKLAIIHNYGFRRLCINPQSMHDDTLRRIGRHHTTADVYKAYYLARKAGFQDINMDLIAGLPKEDEQALLGSARAVLDLDPESITLHTLSIKKGSFFDREMSASSLFKPDRALEKAVEKAHDLLRASGYRPYYLYRQKNCRGGLENTGFARPNYACIYNVAMMSDQVKVIGLGSGSSSKKIFERTAKRFHNPKDIDLYIRKLDDLIERKLHFFQA
ncbi:MAG: radical SAM protein [Saccharofermentanales bacterium]